MELLQKNHSWGDGGLMDFEKFYKQYLSELSTHLFGNAPFDEIVKKVNTSHRTKRFVALYVAQDKETFDTYYAKRRELGLSEVFNQLISALLYQTSRHSIKKELVKELGITKDMIEIPCFDHEINEIKKDLNSFSLYLRKIRMKQKADLNG